MAPTVPRLLTTTIQPLAVQLYSSHTQCLQFPDWLLLSVAVLMGCCFLQWFMSSFVHCCLFANISCLSENLTIVNLWCGCHVVVKSYEYDYAMNLRLNCEQVPMAFTRTVSMAWRPICRWSTSMPWCSAVLVLHLLSVSCSMSYALSFSVYDIEAQYT